MLNKIFLIKNIILLAVFGSVLLAIGLFVTGLIEVYEAYCALVKYDVKEFVIYTLRSADIFLFGMAMIIYALGSYDLFFSTTEENAPALPDWLKFKSFSELKALFIKVIILILIINFVERVFQSHTPSFTLLYIPISILIISISLYFMEKHS